MDNFDFERIFEFILYRPAAFPYIAAFSMLLACGMGLPIPEDLTLFLMGFAAYRGIADFKISVAVCMVGVLMGDSVIYGVGFRYGMRLIKKGVFAKLLPPERMSRTRELFHRYGNKVIFAARFMPGLRAPTYFSAGALHLPYRIFIFYDALASLLSVPLLIGVTYYFGEHIEAAIGLAREVQHGILFLLVGVIALFLLKHYAGSALKSRKKKKRSHANRA